MATSGGIVLVHLLRADDLGAGSWRVWLEPRRPVHVVRASTPAARDRGTIALDDRFVSARHARLDDAAGAWRVTDQGSLHGTWLDGRRLRVGEPAELRDGALLELGHSFFLIRSGAHRAAGDGNEPRGPYEGVQATSCPAWETQLRLLARLARSSLPVLVEGESGTGKELIARALHAHSGRPGALVSVNCAALADNLLEDELFGHVRGAFSGALAPRAGLVRAADRGTLFLDEVGDMPPALQVRLLRVLEDHKVRPLGSEAEIEVDVRVIAATHRDLHALAAQGTFRHDLLARLGLLPFRVPPLRERREDLGLLIRTLLAPEPNGLARVRIEQEAVRRLLLYRWPLNVRELRAALLAAADLAREEDGRTRIGLEHLPAMLREPTATTRVTPRSASPDDEALRGRLVSLLAAHRGNVAAVARALGNKRTNVQRLLARLGIDRKLAGDGAMASDG